MKTNFQLADDLQKLNVPLVGVFNKDRFPKVPRRNGGYVINMQDDVDSQGNDLSGTHWVALYTEGSKAAYFDSFAFPPPRQVQDYLHSYQPYVINDKQIQSVKSGVCGSYVIFFLWFMSRNRQLPFNQRYRFFIDLFSDDPSKNRILLKKHLDKLKINIYD
jgi:hypothetical protein